MPANRIGYGILNLAQLKIVQEVITLSVCVPFAVFYMHQSVKSDYLWAGVCLLGADGTFLEVARHAPDLPILGVNSDPERSTAFFCAANRSTIHAHLEALLARKVGEVRLARMQVTINERLLPYYALNDLLVAHANPAAMTSYPLQLGTICEPQRSSGLWIATAAGSTAAIRAAGGRMLPLRSRKLQYLVRKPYSGFNLQMLMDRALMDRKVSGKV